ncbi:hypothetical protein Bbad01_35110 [Bacillus badius]|nr:hypothetical protein Bbad01_35110 [Bacillus badius]
MSGCIPPREPVIKAQHGSEEKGAEQQKVVAGYKRQTEWNPLAKQKQQGQGAS